jgi:beta-N-acetylhexosaminidase
MERAKARRRLLALAVLVALAALGFAAGAVLGSGGSDDSEEISDYFHGEAATEVGAEAPPRPRLAEGLTPAQLAGERIVVAVDGTGLTPELRGAIHSGKVAGVVLFEADFPSRAAGRELIEALQAVPRPKPLRRYPLLVMTDQEGGQVKRVSGAPEASATTMGAEGAGFARREGRATAKNLRSLGVNVDLAPVLDVARPGGVIADTERGFGSTPAQVAATAVSFATGLQDGGLAATAKHFPGLGAAAENTDFEAQRIGLPKATIRDVDEAPYRAYINAGGKLVMLSTAIYPAFGSRPAAFNRRIAAPPPRLPRRDHHRQPRQHRRRRIRRPARSSRRRCRRRRRPPALRRPPKRPRRPRRPGQAARQRQPGTNPVPPRGRTRAAVARLAALRL